MKKLLLASLLATVTSIASAQSVEISGYFREFVTTTKAGAAQQNINGITTPIGKVIMLVGCAFTTHPMWAQFLWPVT